MRREKFRKIVLVTFGVAFSVIILSFQIFRSQVSYTYGRVIDAQLSDGSIEVQIEEDGPKIFISDLGSYSQRDFKYNDLVDLEFYNRLYHVTNIREREWALN